jgi:hypothetical protein
MEKCSTFDDVRRCSCPVVCAWDREEEGDRNDKRGGEKEATEETNRGTCTHTREGEREAKYIDRNRKEEKEQRKEIRVKHIGERE